MANYSTNLKDWGAVGTLWPDGYSYKEDEAPIDVYDNAFANESITDIKHLIDLTNSRIESDKASTKPGTPESEHLFVDTDDGKFYWYGDAAWHRVVEAGGDTLEGTLDLDSNQLANVGSITAPDGSTFFDGSKVPVAKIETTGLDADQVDGWHKADIQSWVNNSADVPNADHADNADTAVSANKYKTNDIDSDGDGVVNQADYADDADASSYKGNDIDSDGDGVVNRADVANEVDGSNVTGYVDVSAQGSFSARDISLGDNQTAIIGTFPTLPSDTELITNRVTLSSNWENMNTPSGLTLDGIIDNSGQLFSVTAGHNAAVDSSFVDDFPVHYEVLNQSGGPLNGIVCSVNYELRNPNQQV
jgi:hypothetical protein